MVSVNVAKKGRKGASSPLRP